MKIQTLLKSIWLRISQSEILLIAIAATIWLPISGNSYFLSDDFVHLGDWGVPPLSLTWTWFLREYAGFYRPLTALYWKSQYAIWGLDPFGYQLTNALLHTFCAFLIRNISHQIFPTHPRTGLWASLIFLFLPGHIFGVLMISALTGLLCSFFYLAAATTHLYGKTYFSLFFFLLALGTKELALSFPLLIAIWEISQLHIAKSFTWRTWFFATAPYTLLGLSYVLARYFFFGHLPHSPMHENAHPLRLLINATIYIAQMLTPWGLQDLKPFFRTYPQMLQVSAVFIVTLGALIAWQHRKKIKNGQLYSLLWVGVTLLPVLRLYSPWNTYLPAVGIALFIASLVGQSTSRLKNMAFLLLFLGISLYYSLQQQQHWYQARVLSRMVIEAIASTTEENPGILYLANLPAEWNGTPVLIGNWALEKALLLEGISEPAIALCNVIHFQQREYIETKTIDTHTFRLKLTNPPAFFRLETMEVLSGQTQPYIGYTYAKGDIRIKVEGLNAQGQANQLSIAMNSSQSLSQIWIWNGHRIEPLLP